MAKHQKTISSAKHRANNRTKPSRAVRYAKRWDARVAEFRSIMSAREQAHNRALRIVEYLSRRAARKAV